MRKPIYVFSAYLLGFVFSLSFFAFLYFLLQNFLPIGLAVSVLFLLVIGLLVTDPETVQEVKGTKHPINQ